MCLTAFRSVGHLYCASFWKICELDFSSNHVFESRVKLMCTIFLLSCRKVIGYAQCAQTEIGSGETSATFVSHRNRTCNRRGELVVAAGTTNDTTG